MFEKRRPIIEIRPACADDAPSIAELIHDSFAEYEPLYTERAFAATTPSSEQILKRMSDGPIWVALLNDSIVGTVSGVANNDGLYLRGMAVRPEARGREIGWRLLECVEAYACKIGARSLYLSTTPFLARATRLYEKYGFRRSDEGPRELLGTPLFRMVKTLRSSKE